MQAFYFGAGIVVMIIGALFFPESPKYLYSKQRYNEARESLQHIAKMNGAKEFSKLFLFENEVVEEEELEQLLILKKEELINKANFNPDLVTIYTDMEFDLIRNSELTQEATIRQQARIAKEQQQLEKAEMEEILIDAEEEQRLLTAEENLLPQ